MNSINIVEKAKYFGGAKQCNRLKKKRLFFMNKISKIKRF